MVRMFGLLIFKLNNTVIIR